MTKEHHLTLYELEDDLVQAAHAIPELQRPGYEQQLEEALNTLELYIRESVAKRDRCGKFLETLTATQKSIDDEILRLENRRARIEKVRKSMCNYILFIMNKLGVDKLEGQLFSFKARHNPPAVIIDNLKLIPPEYFRQPDPPPPPPPKPDKAAIKSDLQNGIEVPGARLFPKPDW